MSKTVKGISLIIVSLSLGLSIIILSLAKYNKNQEHKITDRAYFSLRDEIMITQNIVISGFGNVYDKIDSLTNLVRREEERDEN